MEVARDRTAYELRKPVWGHISKEDLDIFELECLSVPSDEEDEPKQHYLRLQPAPHPISSSSYLSRKEITSRNAQFYVPLAKKALAYYNVKERTTLSFVEVVVAAEESCPEILVHMNFIASSDDGVRNLLFAELESGDVWEHTPTWAQKHASSREFIVRGCCLLEKIDSGNPLGKGCSLCCGEVIHPGPRDGYRIVGGDAFRGYDFWDYGLYAFRESESRRMPISSESTNEDMDMYIACAVKASNYLYAKQHTNLDVEVTAGANYIHQYEVIVHINFKLTSSGSKQGLYFAELAIPLFDFDVLGSWDAHKESFIRVKGCCLLEIVDSGNPFGRVCGVCNGERVIHPSPRDGYHAAFGDGFIGYEFMDIGQGIY